MSRQFVRPVKRIVVKVGSSVIATYKMQPRLTQLGSLARQISEISKGGVEVILVSSGAIVLGMGELGKTVRPKELAQLQALAAIGQTVLMHTYSELFKKHDTSCAQVLLTWDDFNDRVRYNNARHTLEAILQQGVIPVINENDTIATDEIKFGDNDRLSALVAVLMQADLLLVLSDVEGLYDLHGGEKKIFAEIKEITGEIESIASPKDISKKGKQMSKGGMVGKLNAIKIATQSNIPCIIAHGETEDILSRILKGERIGTFFVEKEEKALARQHWISFGAKPQGILIVDDGAKEALLKGGKSLLLPGVSRFEGHFKKDDVVVVCDQHRQEIARGIINYSIDELHRVEDKKGKREVIHRDDLVLCRR